MAGTTRKGTQGARPRSEKPTRVKEARAGSTAQRLSETKSAERQAPAQATRRRTQAAKPRSEKPSRVQGAKVGLTAQGLSETKGTVRQADTEEPKGPESSASVLDEARPERAPRGEEPETSVADHQPLDEGAESVEVASAEDRPKGPATPEPGHLNSIHEEAPLRGRTLLELCMSNPSFRATVISRLIRKLG